MVECVDWVDDGGLSFVMLCNSGDCGHRVGPTQPMLCDCCEAKTIYSIPVSYSVKGPWTPPEGYKEGQCRCDCHDSSMRHFAPCCDQTYTARAEMVPHAPRPEPRDLSKEDFMKFTMPIVRSKEK